MIVFIVSGIISSFLFYHQYHFCRQGKSIVCFNIAIVYCIYVKLIMETNLLTGAIMLFMTPFYWSLWFLSLFQSRIWARRLPGDRKDPSEYRN